MRRLLVPLLLAAGACAPAAGAPSAPAPLPAAAPARTPLAAALDSVFADTAFGRARWGVVVRALDGGATLYRRDAEKLFVPASNMKVVTGAAALEALGPEFRYRTIVGMEGALVNGEIQGSLVVTGSGDPTVSARFGGDARAVFRAWADSLRARGVRRITGRVVGNDDVFDDVPLGRGWAWDDLDASYSAEFGGLMLNEGFVTVRVAPGAAAGEAARVTLAPATAYVPVTVRATTAAAGTRPRLDVVRAPVGAGIVVSGTVPLDTTAVEEEVAVRNNTLFFATVLRETLVEAGIRVDGPAADADERAGAMAGVPAPTPLFTHASPPMREILPAFLKPSQNQIGEILLRTLGRQLRGAGSGRAGAAAVDSLFRGWGLDTRGLAQADGSGLSRYNLVAPELLAGVLEHMARSPNRQVWDAALPVAGTDGTLAARLRGTPLQGRVHAKTGTLSGVRALSGYVPGPGGERLVFSILLNNHTLSAREADRVVDAALLRISGSPPAPR